MSRRFRERRFVGPGRSWTVRCACGCSQTISTNKGRPLPPEIIIKKFSRDGWQIDGNPKHDLCPQCVRKPIQSRLALATKAIADAAAPMVKAPTIKGWMHFSEMLAVARTLDPHEAKQLIAVLRERIPPKPKVARRPKPEPQADPDYEQWLNQQQSRE